MVDPVAAASVKDHWDVLWIFFLLLLVGGVGDTIRRLIRMEKKQEESLTCHMACREELLNTLLHKKDFETWRTKWELGRDGPGGLWEAINHHAHDPKTGGTVRLK